MIGPTLVLLSALIAPNSRAAAPTVFLYYWPPDLKLRRVGHLALHLTDASGDTYVSFWPKEDSGLLRDIIGTRGDWHDTVAQDKSAEGGKEPRVVDMSGLDEDAIKRFVIVLKGDHPDLKWGLLRGKTCESVAALALQAGGLGVSPCGLTVPMCRRALIAAYSRYLTTHPRVTAALAEAALAPPIAATKLTPTATANASAPVPVPDAPVSVTAVTLAACPADHWRDVNGYCHETARAATPTATARVPPPAPPPVIIKREPRDTYDPDRGANVPGNLPQPTNFGPGSGLKTR